MCYYNIINCILFSKKNEMFVSESGFNKCDKVMYINLKKEKTGISKYNLN